MKTPIKTVDIIGAGPAGLFAAELLSSTGIHVHIYDHKPSVARKFLMAGRGGLNITHSEDFDAFITRYGESAPFLEPALRAFTPSDLREWCAGLGIETFVGTSGRVFPKDMKASPLLRAWLSRLNTAGVQFHLRTRWRGHDIDGDNLFQHEDGTSFQTHPDATLLAMGGASWPSLGSDGSWMQILRERNIHCSDFAPSNCGFLIPWSGHIKSRFSGTPLKSIAIRCEGHAPVQGEIVLTEYGIEGGAVYALSSALRRALPCTLYLDLKPSMDTNAIAGKLEKSPRGKKSFSHWLQNALNLSALATALLYESDPDISKADTTTLAHRIKNIPLILTATTSIDRAISSAGGLCWDEIDIQTFRIKKLGPVFACGEMLDWEAPTGGYLLQGCFATAKAAANGILSWRNKTIQA